MQLWICVLNNRHGRAIKVVKLRECFHKKKNMKLRNLCPVDDGIGKLDVALSNRHVGAQIFERR